ncbi:hypothetical protein [Streptomyces chartreusis]|uniref:hypothetical protein n=1 Tax=Streptomyces chartreusis TaxID=1969 RepID=UPI0036A05C70
MTLLGKRRWKLAVAAVTPLALLTVNASEANAATIDYYNVDFYFSVRLNYVDDTQFFGSYPKDAEVYGAFEVANQSIPSPTNGTSFPFVTKQASEYVSGASEGETLPLGGCRSGDPWVATMKLYCDNDLLPRDTTRVRVRPGDALRLGTYIFDHDDADANDTMCWKQLTVALSYQSLNDSQWHDIKYETPATGDGQCTSFVKWKATPHYA